MIKESCSSTTCEWSSGLLREAVASAVPALDALARPHSVRPTAAHLADLQLRSVILIVPLEQSVGIRITLSVVCYIIFAVQSDAPREIGYGIRARLPER